MPRSHFMRAEIQDAIVSRDRPCACSLAAVPAEPASVEVEESPAQDVPSVEISLDNREEYPSLKEMFAVAHGGWDVVSDSSAGSSWDVLSEGSAVEPLGGEWSDLDSDAGESVETPEQLDFRSALLRACPESAEPESDGDEVDEVEEESDLDEDENEDEEEEEETTQPATVSNQRHLYPAEEQWVCNCCTFMNMHTSAACMMCDAENPAATSWQPVKRAARSAKASEPVHTVTKVPEREDEDHVSDEELAAFFHSLQAKPEKVLRQVSNRLPILDRIFPPMQPVQDVEFNEVESTHLLELFQVFKVQKQMTRRADRRKRSAKPAFGTRAYRNRRR